MKPRIGSRRMYNHNRPRTTHQVMRQLPLTTRLSWSVNPTCSLWPSLGFSKPLCTGSSRTWKSTPLLYDTVLLDVLIAGLAVFPATARNGVLSSPDVGMLNRLTYGELKTLHHSLVNPKNDQLLPIINARPKLRGIGDRRKTGIWRLGCCLATWLFYRFLPREIGLSSA